MRTARLAREYRIETRTTLFPLHPNTPDEGLTLEALFGGRVDIEASHARLAGMMEDEGLPYGRRTHTYNSRRAQELAKWAETQPDGAGIHDALYHAYFVDGVNLAEIAQLVEIAGSLGLPRDEARDAIESGAWADTVDRDWLRARQMGVTAVPTFVVGTQGVVGAYPYEVLERLVVEGGGVPGS